MPQLMGRNGGGAPLKTLQIPVSIDAAPPHPYT